MKKTYYQATRITLTHAAVYSKRSSLEVGINAYNKEILNLFEANMDIQFVLNEYAVATYIINYINKSETGLTKLLREAAQDTREKNNLNHRGRLRHISNVLSNGTLISAQEAAFKNLSLPMLRNNGVTIFTNTGKIDDRVRMTKRVTDLKKMEDDDTGIVLQNLTEKYAERPKKLAKKCLAEFAA